MVGLEALCLGIPVICFNNLEAISHIVQSADAGFVVEYPDYQEVASKIIELMNNTELRKQLGDNGSKFAREYFASKKSNQEIKKIIDHHLYSNGS